MPKVRPFEARPERGRFVAITVTLERATYDALAADARQDGVPVERFVALHLRRCAEARGRSVE
jgi:hypothetical protein